MKRNFKLKTLVASALVVMGLAVMPKADAATFSDIKFKNPDGLSKDDAAFVVTFNVDKETLVPGDTVTLTVGTEKNPGDGLQNFSSKVAWDSSKLDLVMPDGNIWFKAGDVGSEMGLKDNRFGGEAQVQTYAGVENVKFINVGATADVGYPVTTTGTLYQLQFKVKDNASGKVDLYLLTQDEPFGGLDFGGVDKVGSSYGESHVTWFDEKNKIISAYVESNADNLKVPVPATGIEFVGLDDGVSLDVYSNKVVDIANKAKPQPGNTTDDFDINWSSDHPDVVSVENGVLTAKKAGTATITVSFGSFTDTVTVTVTAKPTGLKFTQDKYTLDFNAGETVDLKNVISATPEGATFDVSKVTWSSDNTAAATVNNGVVTAKGKGTANITATYGNVSATTKVTVAVKLTGITVAEADKNVVVWKGEDAIVKVNATPDGAVWETLDTSFNSGSEHAKARVENENVVITGLTRGNAEVLVSADKNKEGANFTTTIAVETKENKITKALIKNEAGKGILRGETLDMVGDYETEYDEETVHATTDSKEMTWVSSNPEVATVDKNGKVTAVSEGETTITLTIAGHEASYVLAVKEIHMEEIVISDEALEDLNKIEGLQPGDVIKVPFTITPDGVTDTVEEILEKINVDYDKDVVDVKVEYDKATGKGVLTFSFKTEGEGTILVYTGELPPEDDEDVDLEDYNIYVFTYTCVEPVVEEAPETGDMPVALMTAMMLASVAGIVASKKVFVK